MYASNFLKAEQLERHLLRQTSGPNTYTVLGESTPGNKAVYDAVCEFKGKKQMVEIKVRSKRYDTAYLEQNKVERLKKAYKEYKLQHGALYLAYYAFYPEQEELYIIDLIDQPATQALDIWCAKHTCGSDRKVHKDFYEYRLDDAWMVDMKTGKLRPPLDPCEKRIVPDINIEL